MRSAIVLRLDYRTLLNLAVTSRQDSARVNQTLWDGDVRNALLGFMDTPTADHVTATELVPKTAYVTLSLGSAYARKTWRVQIVTAAVWELSILMHIIRRVALAASVLEPQIDAILHPSIVLSLVTCGDGFWLEEIDRKWRSWKDLVRASLRQI